MKIICVGGGTLGSVTPLLAVVKEIQVKEKEIQFEWWGTEHGPEKKIIEDYGLVYKPIMAGKFRRYWSWQNLIDIVWIFGGWLQAIWRLGHNKPQAVLTAGSYVAVPVAWAAYFYGVPVFLHQQDVVPSLANRLIIPIAKKITVSLPVSVEDFPAAKTILTGNPVRQEFENHLTPEMAKKKLNLNPLKPVVLIIGGSTGAQQLNELIIQSKEKLLELAQIIHLTGGKIKTEPSEGYIPLAFTTNSQLFLSAADLVITRAGMGTLSELSVLGKPALVIPLPNSHQEKNAIYFAEQKAVKFLLAQGLTSEILIANVSELLNNKSLLNNLSQNIKKIIPTGAAGKIASLVFEELNKIK